jgi:hypothetical protein
VLVFVSPGVLRLVCFSGVFLAALYSLSTPCAVFNKTLALSKKKIKKRFHERVFLEVS